jgi:hypothetical protein
VAHTCNPSYSGSRDQEDYGSVNWGKQHARPHLKNTQCKKKGWWSGSSGKSACIASVKPSVQTPVPTPTKNSFYEVTQLRSCRVRREVRFLMIFQHKSYGVLLGTRHTALTDVILLNRSTSQSMTCVLPLWA